MDTYKEEQYINALIALIRGFEFETCDECGEGIEVHSFAPDVLGNPHVYCLGNLHNYIMGGT